jgi:epoxyqueuosine reductase
MFDRRRVTALVKERAIALGFSAVGVADGTHTGNDAARLEEWLGRGYAASMHWMARRKAERADPAQVLPGIRSVIVVTKNYYVPGEPPEGAPKIARYARGLDYHDVIGPRLEEFVRWLAETIPGAESRWYVDTGPVMEKAWAQRAGLGWVGKHTTLISPDDGSWVFLGVVLTTASLIADEPAADRCGSCTVCIDACPTAAIVEPYVLDARKCIAYLTIEHRGAFDPDDAASLDGWIFGCDACQDMCPWNAKLAHPTDEESFVPRPGTVAPDAGALMAMEQTVFDEQFAGTPVLRAKLAGMKRNCAACAGGVRGR